MAVHKNDLVMVIAGKDRGKRGKVLRVVLETGRVAVEKINIVKRHPRPGGGRPRTEGLSRKRRRSTSPT